MAFRVRFDPEAEAELDAIYDYVRDRSGSDLIAAGYVGRIARRCLRLSDLPEQGTDHGHLRPGLRSIGFERRVTIAFVVRLPT